MNLSDKILVLGDSHTRAFSYNDNFIPFFIGEGKGHCFVKSSNYENIKVMTFGVLSELEYTGGPVLLVFGEPDTRYYIGRGWKPWERKYGFSIGRKRKVRISFARYCRFIEELRGIPDIDLYILNVTPSMRLEQNKLVDYFNELLKKYCSVNQGVEFIDCNQDIYDESTHEVKSEFYDDPVHLNLKLQLLVEEWFIAKSVLRESKYDRKMKVSNAEVKSNYGFNERFGCYMLKT